MPDESPGLRARIARRWRAARAAALIRSVPHAELGAGQPDPALVAPRAHAAVEALAHPAVLELGLPAWLLSIGWQLLRGQHERVVAPPGDDAWPVTLFSVWQLALFALAPLFGRWLFKRRYRRMGRDAYHGRQWRGSHAPAVGLDQPAAPDRANAAPAPTATTDA